MNLQQMQDERKNEALTRAEEEREAALKKLEVLQEENERFKALEIRMREREQEAVDNREKYRLRIEQLDANLLLIRKEALQRAESRYRKRLFMVGTTLGILVLSLFLGIWFVS